MNYTAHAVYKLSAPTGALFTAVFTVSALKAVLGISSVPFK